MDSLFEPTETQALLQSSLQRWLAEAAPFTRRPALLATPAAIEPLWQGLTRDLGLLGATLPERVGGLLEPAAEAAQAVPGLDELLLIARALGAALLPEPWLATAAHGAVLLQALARADAAAGHAAAPATQLLTGVAEGRVRLAVAEREPHTRHDRLQGLRTRASGDLHTPGAALRLSGRKAQVRAAPWASHWLVVVPAAGPTPGPGAAPGLAVALVAPSAPGITRRDVALADGSWAAEIAFDDTPAQALGGSPEAQAAALALATDVATLVTGAEGVGVMQRLLDETLAYLQQRRQFGVPLASFQVLQHRIADMHLALVQADALVGATRGACAGTDAAARARAVSSAQLAVARAARAVGQGAVQLHGGMGMTEELAIGHGFKRLTVIEQQFGSPWHHLQRLAAHAALAAEVADAAPPALADGRTEAGLARGAQAVPAAS